MRCRWTLAPAAFASCLLLAAVPALPATADGRGEGASEALAPASAPPDRSPVEFDGSDERILTGPRITGPAIALIIDDIGYQHRAGDRAVKLPGAVTCAFLPHTPHAVSLARLAHEAGKEVILHLPMEARSGKALGPGGLTAGMARVDFLDTVERGIRAVPHAVGVSNHMGSLLTRHPESMSWLMQALRGRGALYFVDSKTIGGSVAASAARANEVPVTSRDVFLDHGRGSHQSISERLDELVAIARRRGTAVGIAHPYPQTLDVLESRLPALRSRGVALVPVSSIIALREAAGAPPAPKSAAGWRLHPVHASGSLLSIPRR